MSQTFFSILVTYFLICSLWGTIRQLLILLPRSWKWRNILDFEIASSPNNLAGLPYIARSTASESMVLGQLESVRQQPFLLLKRNFSNHQVTGAAPSPFAQQTFLVTSAASYPSSNSYSKSSRLRLRCMFICATFKSRVMEWNKAQRVSAPTTTILQTTASNDYGLNCFGHVLNTPQTNRYQNIFFKFCFTLIIDKINIQHYH